MADQFDAPATVRLEPPGKSNMAFPLLAWIVVGVAVALVGGVSAALKWDDIVVALKGDVHDLAGLGYFEPHFDLSL